MPNSISIRRRGCSRRIASLPCIWGFFVLFISVTSSRPHRWTDFDDLCVIRRLSTQGCIFGGFCWYRTQFMRLYSKKNNFGGVNRRFQAKREVSYYQNWCIDSNQILPNVKHNQVLFACGPNRHPSNPRRLTAAILKKTVKLPHLRNLSTAFDEIWNDDAYWHPTADQPLKIRIFESPTWRRPPSWKSQNRDISTTVWFDATRRDRYQYFCVIAV